MARARSLAVVLWAGVCATCGGGGGSSPVAPAAIPTAAATPKPSGWAAGTLVTVVSGETDAPVAGARVNVAGTPLTTDEIGRVSIPYTVAEGASVDVVADDYLSRQTTAKYAVTRVDLWPDSSWLPGAYTQKLVYTQSSVTDDRSIVPLERLSPKVRRVVIAPSDDLKGQPGALAALRQGADWFNAAVAGRVVFALDGAGDLTVAARIAPDDASCGGNGGRLLARTWVSGYEVTRAEIIFCSDQTIQLASPVAHEIGHIYGLGHSGDNHDLMFPYYYRSDPYRTFTDREVLLMGLIDRRRGGNVWPDNDRTAKASGNRVRVFVD